MFQAVAGQLNPLGYPAFLAAYPQRTLDHQLISHNLLF